MNRKILFRGKRIDNGEWVRGLPFSFHANNNVEGIETYDGERHKVDPDTVGQYTGLTDNSGNNVFEGDIIKFWSQLYIVGYSEKRGCFLGHRSHMPLECGDDLQLLCNGIVVSNILDDIEKDV